MGEWYVDGSIVMKSGVFLDGRCELCAVRGPPFLMVEKRVPNGYRTIPFRAHHCRHLETDGEILLLTTIRYSIDDSPHTTDIILEEGGTDSSAISAIVVVDGISDAKVSERLQG